MLKTNNIKSREELMLLKFNKQTFSTYLLKVQLKNIVRKIMIQQKYYGSDDLFKNNQLIQRKNIYYNYSKNKLTIHENFNQTLKVGELVFPTYDKLTENFDFTRKINNLINKFLQNGLSNFYENTIKNNYLWNHTLYDYLHFTNLKNISYKNMTNFLLKHNIKLKLSTLKKIQPNIGHFKNDIKNDTFSSFEYIQNDLLEYDVFSYIHNPDVVPKINGISFNIFHNDPLKQALSNVNVEYKNYVFNHIINDDKILFISNQSNQSNRLNKQQLVKQYKKFYIKYLHNSNDYAIMYKKIIEKIETNNYVTIQLKQDEYIDSYIYISKKSVQ